MCLCVSYVCVCCVCVCVCVHILAIYVSDILKVFAIDMDTEKNGPPFKFRSKPGDPSLANFNLVPDASYDNGRGGIRITTSKKFDREQQKSYDIPIIVTDSGEPAQSAERCVFLQ